MDIKPLERFLSWVALKRAGRRLEKQIDANIAKHGEPATRQAIIAWLEYQRRVAALEGEIRVWDWILDEYGCWNLRIGAAHVWLQPRPAYCDRGHWHANVMGIPHIDDADAFPRYFMDLDRAKLEMQEWLQWRLECERQR